MHGSLLNRIIKKYKLSNGYILQSCQEYKNEIDPEFLVNGVYEELYYPNGAMFCRFDDDIQVFLQRFDN